MYIQNINNIQLAVIMLDGCILDLNRYRYNYYHNMCNELNISITKDEFYNHLSNMYDMYNQLPLHNKYNSSSLNSKIEDELYTYLKYKGTYPKEGLFELLNYFHQKDIKIAIMSTHSTKRAVEYLKITRVYSHVDYIIGSDTKNKPLPSDEMLKAIFQQFDIHPHNTLVISPFLLLNKVAVQLETNVFYYKDLIEPTAEELSTSFKTVSSFFEILNSLLFDRIYDKNIYSSMLGMSNKMNKEELNSRNQVLQDIYNDDPQILNIIEDTYQFHLKQLNKKDTINSIEETKESENIDQTDEIIEPINNDSTDEIIISENNDLIEETKEIEINNSIDEVIEKENNSARPLLSLNQEEQAELTQAWNKLMINENSDHNDERVKEETREKTSLLDILLYIFTDFIYSFAISFLILFIGIIATIVIDNNSSFEPLFQVFQQYYSIIEIILTSLFDALHSILSFIPNYNDYLTSLTFITSDGVQLLHILIFNTLVIFIIKMIILCLKKDKIFTSQEDD